MNKPKFTPGPWKANIYDRAMGDTGDYYPERTVESPLNICVCQCFEHDNNEHTGEEEADANAHLIAAAPEMYDVLSKLGKAAYDVGQKFDVSGLISLAREAGNLLKKARGE